MKIARRRDPTTIMNNPIVNTHFTGKDISSFPSSWEVQNWSDLMSACSTVYVYPGQR